MTGPNETDEARRAWMGLLAQAQPAWLEELWAGFCEGAPAPAHEWLRAPEIGAVMVRGRAGAVGAPFNLGEMTVTRCALRLESGEVGQAWTPGRDKAHAERAALADALLQGPRAAEVRRKILAPLAGRRAAARAAKAAKAAKTKVEFFTMTRGDD